MTRSSLLILCGALGALAACTSETRSDLGQGEQDSVEGDRALATQVVKLLEQKCGSCHEVTPSQIRAWGDAMKTVESECIQRPGLTARQRIDCLRSDPNDPASSFGPERLGLFATAATQASMASLFRSAFDEATWKGEYDRFTGEAKMPRSSDSLTPGEFSTMEGWVMRGMPQLDRVGSGSSTRCTPSTSGALQSHIQEMKTDGWGARLADQATPMFGCGGDGPLGCLARFPDATKTFGAPDTTQTLRTLRQQAITQYWARSSPDGRFIGFGRTRRGMFDSTIVDLSRPANTPPIAVEAEYDPNFLPSNDGFAYAGARGSSPDGNFKVCRMSLLADVSGAAEPAITLREPRCSELGSDVYQSIGAALDGSRFFVTVSQHRNDNGGSAVTRPFDADYSDESAIAVVPMVNDGLTYRAEPETSVTLPGEGDIMLSPSSRLAATRFGGAAQSGYRIRLLKARGAGSNLGVTMPLAAEVCVTGGKVNFSFDERFIAVHQYVDPENTGGLPAGSSNIVIVDLATSKTVRITQLKARQFALYPHFRADGWLYFLVRDMTTKTEVVVASDVALRLAQ